MFQKLPISCQLTLWVFLNYQFKATTFFLSEMTTDFLHSASEVVKTIPENYYFSTITQAFLVLFVVGDATKYALVHMHSGARTQFLDML